MVREYQAGVNLHLENIYLSYNSKYNLKLSILQPVNFPQFFYLIIHLLICFIDRFDEMDKEGYGKINLNQFVEFLQAYDITASKDSIRSLFVEMNKSGNGILLGDFEKWIKGKNIDSIKYFLF